jgi:hypothetical protein
MTPNFEDLVTAAQAAVAAEARHAAAQAALAAAEGEADTIRRRILDLDGQRGAIVGRRREGERPDDDGATLSLLDTDLEGLRTIQAERDAAVARTPADAAAQALASAQFQLRRAEALAAEAAMAEHATALQERLLEALAQLDAVGQQIGRAGRSIWFPSQRLNDALVRLSVQNQRGW